MYQLRRPSRFEDAHDTLGPEALAGDVPPSHQPPQGGGIVTVCCACTGRAGSVCPFQKPTDYRRHTSALAADMPYFSHMGAHQLLPPTALLLTIVNPFAEVVRPSASPTRYTLSGDAVGGRPRCAKGGARPYAQGECPPRRCASPPPRPAQTRRQPSTAKIVLPPKTNFRLHPKSLSIPHKIFLTLRQPKTFFFPNIFFRLHPKSFSVTCFIF